MSESEIFQIAAECGITFQSHIGMFGRQNVMTNGSVHLKNMDAFAAAIRRKTLEEAAVFIKMQPEFFVVAELAQLLTGILAQEGATK